MFLQKFDVVEDGVQNDLVAVVEQCVFYCVLLLDLVLLVVQQNQVQFMHLFVFLLHKFGDLLLYLRQIGYLDCGDSHIDQIPQYEVIKVDSTHRGQIG